MIDTINNAPVNLSLFKIHKNRGGGVFRTQVNI